MHCEVALVVVCSAKNIRAVSSAVWADKGPVWRPANKRHTGDGSTVCVCLPPQTLRCHTILRGTHSHPYPLLHISILKWASSAFDRTQPVSSRFIAVLLARGLAATLWFVAVGQRCQLAGWQEAVRHGVWVTADSGFGVAPCGAVRITALCVWGCHVINSRHGSVFGSCACWQLWVDMWWLAVGSRRPGISLAPC